MLRSERTEHGSVLLRKRILPRGEQFIQRPAEILIAGLGEVPHGAEDGGIEA